MPARAWAEFLDVYYRPHLLVVNFGTPTDGASGRKLVDLLQQLIESLRLTADYAILLEEQEVKVAFESDLDAEVARGLLRARIVERGSDEWTSKSICDFPSRP
jgi:hypothetical protein